MERATISTRHGERSCFRNEGSNVWRCISSHQSAPTLEALKPLVEVEFDDSSGMALTNMRRIEEAERSVRA